MDVTAIGRALVDLAVPTACGGCGRPGVDWCDSCDDLLCDTPLHVTPRVGLPVAVWAAAHYRDPHRRAVIELKEHRRVDLVRPLSHCLASLLIWMGRHGQIPDRDRLVLVPAPTRVLAARRRGGDPVTRVARAAASLLGDRVTVSPMVRTAATARDSTGLSVDGRIANMADAVRVLGRRAPPPPDAAVVLVDDVLTTGSTCAATIAALAGAGIGIDAVAVIAAA